MNMRASQNCIDFIKGWEKCRLRSYQDGGGVWTIGWGHTGHGIDKNMVWTQERADAQFLLDLSHPVFAINTLVKVPLTQNQFDALASFCFNVGTEAFARSTLLMKLNQSDFVGAAAEFLRWDKDNGVVVRGLTRRRIAESALFQRTAA